MLRRPVGKRRDRDPALLGELAERQTVAGPPFKQTMDAGARMALLPATSVAASGAGEQVGVTRQLLEAGYSALSRPSGARQVG